MFHLSMVSVFVLLLLHGARAQERENGDQMMYEQSSNQWFEGPGMLVGVSADGEWAVIRVSGHTLRLVSLKTGQEDHERLTTGLDSIARAAVFCGKGELARFGKQGVDNGWFLPRGQERQLVTLPPGAWLQCSPDGTEIAYYFPYTPDAGLSVGPIGSYANYAIKGRVTGLVFSPDSKALYVLAFRPEGSALVRITLNKPGIDVIANHLDTSPRVGDISILPDGRSLLIALASNAAPDDAMRHQPTAQRWLKIYQLDLATGTRHPVVESAKQDNFSPTVANGHLYWNRHVIHEAVALLPVRGGEAKEIVVDGEVPMWSPDGGKISYVFGGWRIADWALNLDTAVVSVDAKGNRISKPAVMVSGYHEDFPAAWSPNGRWIAFHSHRSEKPVPEYDSPGSTDDIYLRRADDAHAPEIRLTDFGWEAGPAFWSPDGQKLMFNSWVKGGQPGISKIWIITLEPESGKVLHTNEIPLSAEIRSAEWCAWSPDGKEIAVEDNRGGEDRSLWIMAADGTHAQKILDYKASSYGGLDWTPDGKMIIYAGLAGDRMQLFAVPHGGGSPSQLSHDSANLMHPRVSPDGRWIACTRLVQSRQIWRRRLPNK